MSEAIDRVGLGVDLLGGPETLTMLREIRAEMVAIAQLGGRGQSAATNLGVDLSAREKVFRDSNKRIAEDRIRAEKIASQEEIDIRAAAMNKKLELNRKINERAEQLRQEEKRRQIAAQQEEAARHRQYLEQRAARVKAYSQLEGIETRDLTTQRRAFQRYRNDPARDRSNPNDQTNVFRRQLAEEVQGQRNALREKRRVFEEEKALNLQIETERKVQADRARRAEIERRSNDPRVLSRRIDPSTLSSLPSSLRNDIEIDLAAQRLANKRNADAQELAAIQADRAARSAKVKADREASRVAQFAQQRQLAIEEAKVNAENRDFKKSAVGTARAQLLQNAPDNQIQDYRNISARRAQAQQEISNLSQIRNRAIADNRPLQLLSLIERRQEKAIENYKLLATAERQYLQGTKTPYAGFGGGYVPPTAGGAGGAGGGGGSRNRFVRERFGGDRDNVLNPRGFFTSLDAVGRITRNILLYEVVSRASYGLADYISKSIQAAKTTVEFSNALRFATESAGGNVAENERLAESLGPLGLSRQQGRAAVTEAVRFAENRPQDTARLVNVVTNIAAERGGGIDRTDELIEQLRRRESKFYKRIFGKTVESIYADEGARVVDARTTSVANNPSLYKGLSGDEFKSRSDQIKEYVARLDDAGKEQAVFNYILSQESKFAGEAAERATTLAGRLDKVSAALLNGQEGLGLFITDLKILKSLADSISKGAGFLDSLRPATIGRTGQQGTISNYDIAKYGIDSTTGTRARLLETVNSGLPTLGVLGATLGVSALLGRKSAIQASQAKAYDEVMNTVATKFRGDMSAATNEAIYRAQNTRASFTKQVGAGLSRVTNSLTARVNDTIAVVAETVGADRTARAAYRRSNLISGQLGVIGPSSLSQSYRDAINNGRAVGGVGGGIAGGVIGATVGSFVADKITSNQIVATGITILGGVAGTAAGTTIGNAIGSGVGGYLATSGGVGGALSGSVSGAGLGVAGGVGALGLLAGYGIGSVLEPIVSSAFGLPAYQQKLDEQNLKKEEARAIAYRSQVRERNQLLEDARIRYRSISVNGPLGLLTGAEVAQRGDAVGNTAGGFKNYLEEILPPLTEAEKKIRDFTKSRDKLVAEIVNNQVLPQNIKDRQIEQLNKQLEQDAFDTRNPKWKEYIDDYRARQSESIAKRLAKDKAEADNQRNKYVSELGNALSKLRDAAQGAFKLPGDIGTSIAGEENPYVKVLADQITTAERMRQQWGFLGQAAVDYFTTIELRANARQLNKLEFGTYSQRTNLLRQADSELSQRNGLGVSRREQEYLDIQSAIIDKAVEIPKLWGQAAQILGQSVNPLNQLTSRITSLQVATGLGANPVGPFGRIAGFSAGQRSSILIGPDGTQTQLSLDAGRTNDYSRYALQQLEFVNQPAEVRRQIQSQYADAALGIFSEFSPQQIRSAGLGQAYLGAINVKAQGLDYRIEEAQKKAQLNAIEDYKLQQQLRDDERFRAAQLAKGYDARDVGREADALLLSRTEGIAPKDLTFSQFKDRQEALRRQAERQEQDREEAKKAVQEGLRFQEKMLGELEKIRAGLLSGDMSLLVQVQNDTQARIDQSALQELASGNYYVPLDQSEVKSNPYSGAVDRYGRGGRKK